MKASVQAVLAVIASLTLPLAASPANCTYRLDHDTHRYTCDLRSAIVLTESAALEIEGEHLAGHDDDDVTAIHITESVIHFVPASIFEKFVRLEDFYALDAEVERIQPDALHSCAHLEAFRVERSRLAQLGARLFEECAKLREVSLVGGQLTLLASGDVFHAVGATTLQRLDLSFNRMTALYRNTFDGLTQLRELNLEDNLIVAVSELAFRDLDAIEVILLARNKIFELNFNLFSEPGPRTLRVLELAQNDIRDLTPTWFDNMHRLEFLDLTDNFIGELPVAIFAPLASLRTLYLDRNRITRLTSSSFGQHNETRIFTIDDNELLSIEPGFFDSFPQLEYFHATDNACIDDFLFNDNKPIDFNNRSSWQVLSECYGNHDPRQGVFGGNYLIFVWIGLGAAVAICVVMFVLHEYFGDRLKKPPRAAETSA